MEDFVRREFGGAKLFLVDQSLVRAGGHYLTYNRSLMEAARDLGLEPWILAGNMLEPELSALPNVLPVFSGSWHTPHDPLLALAPAGSTLPQILPFASELMLALRRLGAARRDHVFIHTIGFHEAVELHRMVLQTDMRALPRIHLLCRRDLDEAPPGSDARFAFEFAIQALYKLSRIGLDIRFYTDTPELSLHYSQNTGVRFVTLPLPFGIDVLEVAMEARAPERAGRASTQICYLGDARDEKGYQHLPAAIDGLPGPLRQGQMHFVLQSNFNRPGGEPKVARARARLQTMPRQLVDLRLKPLSDPEYFEVLASSDATFVAYDEVNYARRSSGVFTESLYAGVIPIVPAGTSMAAQLPKGFPSIYSTVAELPGIVADIHTRKHELKNAIAEVSARWRGLHSPKNLLLQLLCAPNASPFDSDDHVTRDAFEYGVQVAHPPTEPEEDARPLVCAHVIDLESLYWKIGAGYVKRLQAGALVRQGILTFAVMVIHHVLDETSPDHRMRPSHWVRQATLIAHELGYAGFWIVYRRAHAPTKLTGILGEMANRSQVMSSEEMMKFLANVTPDFVYSNYAQNHPTLQRCGLASLPFIIETHDVQAHHAALYDKEAQADADAAAELAVYKQAHAVSCLTELDGQYVRENGIPEVEHCLPLIIPQVATEASFAGLQDLAELLSASGAREETVNIEKAWATGQTDQLMRLFGETRMNMVFVGGWHRPNIEGMTWFYNEVFKPFLEPTGKNLFVFGGIFPERAIAPSPQIYWAGLCDTLELAYASAEIVIAPLLHGTGVNIKVLEALAWGKPIVATTVALRGIRGAAEMLGAYDEPDAFARRVLALSDKPLLRREAANNSRKLYRRLLAENNYDAHVQRLVARISSSHAGEKKPQPIEAPAFVNAASAVEWSVQRTHLARYVRHILEGGVDIPSFTRVLDQIASAGELKSIMGELSALFETKSAAALQDSFLSSKLSFPKQAEPTTAREALRWLLLRAIDNIYAPLNTDIVDSCSAAKSATEIVAALVSPADAPRIRVFEADLVSGDKRSLQTTGFDFLIWNGPKGVGELFTSWLVREVISTDPSLRDASIMIVGGRASASFAGLNIVHVEDVERLDPLMLVAKSLILPAQGMNLAHPLWLRTALMFASAGKIVLSPELGLACEGRPELNLGQDKDAWTEAMLTACFTASPVHPRPDNALVDSKEIRELAPGLGIYMTTLSGMDLRWSPAHVALGYALATLVGEDRLSGRNARELQQRLNDERFLTYAETVIAAWTAKAETQRDAVIGTGELSKLIAAPTLANLLAVLADAVDTDWVKSTNRETQAVASEARSAKGANVRARPSKVQPAKGSRRAREVAEPVSSDQEALASITPLDPEAEIDLDAATQSDSGKRADDAL